MAEDKNIEGAIVDGIAPESLPSGQAIQKGDADKADETDNADNNALEEPGEAQVPSPDEGEDDETPLIPPEDEVSSGETPSDIARPSSDALPSSGAEGLSDAQGSSDDSQDSSGPQPPPSNNEIDDSTDSLSDKSSVQTEINAESIKDDGGVSVSDDELWDDSGGLDEIPLFDDLDIPEEDDKEEGKDLEDRDEKDKADKQAKDDKKASDSVEEPLIDEDDETDTKEKEPSDEGQEEDDGDIKKDIKSLKSLILSTPFIATSISILLFIIGLITLIRLIIAEPPILPYYAAYENQAALKGKIGPNNILKQDNKITTKDTAEQKGYSTSNAPKRSLFAMNLDPFIIPAQMSGDLVFFKLKTELIFSSQKAQAAFKENEAWVRDIIYSELKGINISAGLTKATLMSHRGPIMKRLNSFLAPYRVEDIRLIGFLLK